MPPRKPQEDPHDLDVRERKDAAQEEEREAASHEEEAPQYGSMGGNAMAAEARGAEVAVDPRRDQGARNQKGTPDDGDPDGDASARPPEASGAVAAEMFGDAGWVPPNPPLAAAPVVEHWFEDTFVPLAARKIAFQRMQEVARTRAAPPPPVRLDGRGWVEPSGEVAARYALPWAKEAARWFPPTAEGALLAWWTEGSTHALGAASGGRVPRTVRAAAIATLALRHAQAPPHLALRLDLDAQRGTIDELEHQLAAGRARARTAAELLSPTLRGDDLDPLEQPEDEPPLALQEDWAALLALRPGSTWRDPGPRRGAASHAGRAFAAPPGEAERQRREHLANLGIGLFRELLRQRVRVAGAVAMVARLAHPRVGHRLDASLRALVDAVDTRTAEALTALQPLGRGLTRPPYLRDDDARAILEDIVAQVDAIAAGVPWYFAQWTRALTGEDRLVTRPALRPHPVREALRAGRADRARAALQAPGKLSASARLALLPPCRADLLTAAYAEARSAGDVEGTLLLGIFAGPVLCGAGRADEALAMADHDAELALTLGYARASGDVGGVHALFADASLRRAGALVAMGRDPLAHAALTHAGATLLQRGAPGWAEHLASWAPAQGR